MNPLLELIAASAISAIVAGGAAFQITGAASLIVAQKRQSEALSTARNILELARASPCDANTPCPESFQCNVETTYFSRSDIDTLDGIFAVRTRIALQSDTSITLAELETFIRRPLDCSTISIEIFDEQESTI